MKITDLSENTFFASRKHLMQVTQTDALACIAAAQAQVCSLLKADGFAEPILRLAKSDIAETLMAKKALELAELPDYQSVESAASRQMLLQFSLGLFLFYWLAPKLNAQGQSSLDAILKLYIETK